MKLRSESSENPLDGTTYSLVSAPEKILNTIAFFIACISFFGIRSPHPIFLAPLLIAAVLALIGRTIWKAHARFHQGIYYRYSRHRVVEEFDLSQIESWTLTARKDSEGFDGATLSCKSRYPNAEFKWKYSRNHELFRDLLLYLHKEKRGFTQIDLPALEQVLPESATEIRAILKNW